MSAHCGWLRTSIIRQREAGILSASESRICTSVKMAEPYRQSPLLTDNEKAFGSVSQAHNFVESLQT